MWFDLDIQNLEHQLNWNEAIRQMAVKEEDGKFLVAYTGAESDDQLRK